MGRATIFIRPLRPHTRSHLLALAAALSLLGSAKAPPSQAPVLEPKKEASTTAGAAKLSPPIDGMVLLAGGSFDVGISLSGLAAAIDLCRSEVLCANQKGVPYEYPFAYELHVHTVFLDAFFIDRTEVTVAAYRRCVNAGDCSSPTFAAGDPKFDRDDYPVTHVSYEDARKYCEFRGARLPTEAEWERAARGGKPRRYPWGDLPNPKLANHGALDLGSLFFSQAGGSAEPIFGIPDPNDGFMWLAPVASFPAGATPEGVHDLAGNVSEWVSDWWSDNYVAAPVGNPKGPPSSKQNWRVTRGGSYRHPMAMIRGSSRQGRAPSARDGTIGFRCARDGKA